MTNCSICNKKISSFKIFFNSADYCCDGDCSNIVCKQCQKTCDKCGGIYCLSCQNKHVCISEDEQQIDINDYVFKTENYLLFDIDNFYMDYEYSDMLVEIIKIEKEGYKLYMSNSKFLIYKKGEQK